MAGTRICSGCAKRQRAIAKREAEAKRRAEVKRASGRKISAAVDEAKAATLGAVLAVSEAAGKALGIDDHGEVEDGSGTDPSPEPDSGCPGSAG